MMTLPPAAERYLQHLTRGLSPLAPTEREEIVAELRAHLAERAGRGGDPLEGFEPAEDLAAGFLSERALRGALAQGGSVALGRALLGAGRTSLVYLLGFFPLAILQFSGVACLVVAALKPFMPTRVGLSIGPGAFHVGVQDVADPAVREVLGWWGFPVLAGAGALLFWGASRAMRALARHRLSASGREVPR